MSEYLRETKNFFGRSNIYNFWREQDITKTNMHKIVVQNNDISQFLVWNNVFHPKFWNWKITELNGEIASISFPWNSIKKMNIRIAPVKKV
jgi:hypothetical protein